VAKIYRIYLHNNNNCFYEDSTSEERKEYNEKEKALKLLEFFKDTPEELTVLVDDLSPEAVLSIRISEKDHWRNYEELDLYYYHPEMDKRNYVLFEKYGLIGKLIKKYW
jgi:hypothetical protein